MIVLKVIAPNFSQEARPDIELKTAMLLEGYLKILGRGSLCEDSFAELGPTSIQPRFKKESLLECGLGLAPVCDRQVHVTSPYSRPRVDPTFLCRLDQTRAHVIYIGSVGPKGGGAMKNTKASGGLGLPPPIQRLIKK